MSETSYLVDVCNWCLAGNEKATEEKFREYCTVRKVERGKSERWV